MTRRSFTNQEVQIGKETTKGTFLAAGHILGGMATWEMGAKVTTKQFPTVGRHYMSASALLTDESTGKVSGVADSATMNYIFGSHWGSGGPLLHSPSTTAYDYSWTPVLVGKNIDTAFAYDIQCGDATEAEQYTFCVFNGFHYSFSRTQEITFESDLIAQAFTAGVTKTVTPTFLAPNPLTGGMANLYLDPTSAALGTTQLTTSVLNFDYKADPYYKPYYPVNRTNSSYVDLIDTDKKHTVTFKLEGDSASIGYKATYLAVGARAYVRVDVQGPLIDVANSIHASFKHDMALFITEVKPFADTDGIYAIEYTGVVAEDTSWSTGTAQIIKTTSLLAAIA